MKGSLIHKHTLDGVYAKWNSSKLIKTAKYPETEAGPRRLEKDINFRC